MSAISLSIDVDSAQSTANSSNISIQETFSFEGGEGSENWVREDEGRTAGLYVIERAVSVHILSMASQQLRGHETGESPHVEDVKRLQDVEDRKK